MHERIRRVPGTMTGHVGDETYKSFAADFQASFRAFWLTAAGIIGDPALAEDIVQEAALIALGKLDQFRPGTNVTAWVGAIVRNVALNHVRKERTRKARRFDPQEWDRLDPKQRTWQGEIRDERSSEQPATLVSNRRLLTALSEVGETARACLLLRTLEAMDYARISELLDIPEGTAMSHVHRARRLLRERLSDFGTDDATAAIREDG